MVCRHGGGRRLRRCVNGRIVVDVADVQTSLPLCDVSHRLFSGMCFLKLLLEQVGKCALAFRFKTPIWRRHGIVAWIIKILEHEPCKLPDRSVAWNDVQMNMPILVLQEGIVEMVRRKRGSQQRRGLPKLLV